MSNSAVRGARRLPLPDRPRSGGALQDAAAESRLGPGARGHHPDEHPGPGIAWDRSQPGVIYGIIRATAKELAEGGGHKVTVFRLVEKP